MTNSNYRFLSPSGTFAAFRHRNYRLWFAGQLISLIGTWMQNAAQSYLVFTLTDSEAYLGYVSLAAGVPSILFMLYGGVIADRVPRRTLLIITEAIMMLLAFVLAALVFTNLVQPWHILVLAFLLGTANAFDFPARQSLITELVSREDMTNAIALNGTMFNLGVIVGPSAAGIVYALTGPAWCFTINGISYIAVIAALALMHVSPQPGQGRQPEGMSEELSWLERAEVQFRATRMYIKEGFEFVLADRLVTTVVIAVFIINIFGFGLVTLIPAWAVEILKGDVTTNGLLISARGVGAVIGGLLIATMARSSFRGKMWSVNSFVLPVGITAFVLTRNLPLALVFMAVMGFALISIMNNSNAMVQSRVPDALRGRVMALYSLMLMGGGPLGSVAVSQVAEYAGAPTAGLICAAALAVFAVAIWFARPEVREMG